MAEMNQTPDGMRTRIAFFGRRNAGKSSLINALTGQDLAIVSDVPGTTTDPVSKAMEILPLGPCLVTDTAGLDDEGELGTQRVEKTKEAARRKPESPSVTRSAPLTAKRSRSAARYLCISITIPWREVPRSCWTETAKC